MNPIASDLNNTDFTGAMNPDAQLAVRFYSKPVKNEWESNLQGRPIFIDVDYVEIMKPGDPTTIINTPVRDDHKKRWPLHWAHYQNRHGDDPKQVGTPLSQWPRITPAQVEELRALKFFTVENVAGASDASLQRIGMVAGMSPFAFRDAAIRYLQVAKDDATVTQAAEAAKAAEERAKALEIQNAEMQAQMKAMQAQIAMLAAPKKRGPKPKEVTKKEAA